MNMVPFPLSILVLFFASFTISACGESQTPMTPDAGMQGTDAGTQTGVDAGVEADAGEATDSGRSGADRRRIGTEERPALFLLPPGHDGVTPLPVLFLLHGYGATGGIQDAFFQFSAEAGIRDVYMVIPDGTTDSSAKQFWNATDQCCDFNNTNVDDEGYLMGLLDEVEGEVPVDTAKVYFTGHSNGGFMSYRLACNHSDRITAVLSLAGGGYLNDADCGSPEPVSVLHVHGTSDGTIPFTVAQPMIDRWTMRDGCTGEGVALPNLDIDEAVAGDETSRETFTECTAGTQVEFWTIAGGSHIPSLNATFRQEVFAWLLNQSK